MTDFQYTNCLLCNSENNSNLIAHKNDQFLTKIDLPDHKVTWVVCKNCGFVYQNPRPSEDLFNEIYKKDYRADRPSEKYFMIIGADVKERAQWIRNHFSGTSVLDIGAAAGLQMKALRSNGFEVYGIEPNRQFSRFGREKYKLDLYTGKFPRENEGRYDLIILSHVLEHIHDPESLIRDCKKYLNPNGNLFVEIPDLESPKYDFFQAYIASQHLYLFDLEKLEYFLNNNEFECLAKDKGPRGIRVLARSNTTLDSNLLQSISLWKINRIKARFLFHRAKVYVNTLFRRLFGRYIWYDLESVREWDRQFNEVKPKG